MHLRISHLILALLYSLPAAALQIADLGLQISLGSAVNLQSEIADLKSAKINPNYKTINAEQATSDSDPIYNFARSLIALRAKTPAFAGEDGIGKVNFGKLRGRGERRGRFAFEGMGSADL